MSDQQLPPPSWPSSDSSGSTSDATPPPPPPPPPAPTTGSGDAWSTPGTASDRATDAWSGGDADGWAPPPQPRRRGGSRWLLVLAGLVVLVVVGAGIGLVVGDDEPIGSADSTAEAADQPTAPGATTEGSGGAESSPDRPRSTGTGDLTAAEADAHRDLFDAIDRSERMMLALNEDLPASADDLSESELGGVRDAVGARAAELRAVRDDLTSADDAGSDAVQVIRDAYLGHLDAWIEWAEAVADDPSLLDRPDDAVTYFDAINFTAEDFTNAVSTNLDPDRVPEDVVDLADDIIERGFQGSGDDGTDI